jgi:hypothetical protein
LVATAALFWTIAIPVLSVLLAWRWRTSLVAIVLYQLSWGALVAVIAIARHGRAGWNMLGLLVTVQGFLLGLTAWWPMLLLLLVGHRSLRAVAPIAFASAAAGFTALIGVVLLRAAIFNWPDTPAALLTFLRHSGLNMLLFIAAPLFTAWLVAVSLSRCFGLRRFSDRQLLADFGWLLLILYAFARLGESPNTPAPLIVAGVATFAGYRLIVELGLRVVVGRLRRPPCLNLLLLRTFGFERRMGTLFETVGQWWRFNGNVIMIAGGDLAAPTLDPAQFIRFLGGNLSGQFLRSADDLSTRLTEFSSTPDPDGRYRVNQLYCSASVWQRALVALLERTDIVLMDARGLTAKHQGCVFELQQLAARIDPGRIVLVVDGTTDRTVVDAPFSAAGSPHVITLPNNRASLRSLVRSMETWVEASARAV